MPYGMTRISHVPVRQQRNRLLAAYHSTSPNTGHPFPMNQVQRFPLFHPFSRRLHLLVLCMIGLFNSTYMNVNLAITMTCMVNSTAVSMETEDMTEIMENITMWSDDIDSSTTVCSSSGNGRKVLDYGGSLVWNHHVQNLLFSASFWGAIATILPSIFLVQRMNKRLVFMLCVLNKVSSFLVLLPYSKILHYLNQRFCLLWTSGLPQCFSVLHKRWLPMDFPLYQDEKNAVHTACPKFFRSSDFRQLFRQRTAIVVPYQLVIYVKWDGIRTAASAVLSHIVTR
ncbi:hypothetical protein COOONC_14947 [Cooperia oncophora]